ncbi:hypothetical protein ACFE04_021217 [Oxalis oulophora]
MKSNNYSRVSALFITSLSLELFVVIEYKIAEIGYLRFYLASKIEEEDEQNGVGAADPRQKAETKPKQEVKPKAEAKATSETKPKVESKPVMIDVDDEIEPAKTKPKVKKLKYEEIEAKPETEVQLMPEVMEVE